MHCLCNTFKLYLIINILNSVALENVFKTNFKQCSLKHFNHFRNMFKYYGMVRYNIKRKLVMILCNIYLAIFVVMH